MIVQGKLSKQQKLAINYFADVLLTKQLKKHIILNIRFIKNLPVCGYTEVEDCNNQGKPREFVLEIKRNMSQKQTLKTLAHELVHCKQYAYGEIDELGTKWLSRKFDHDSVPYNRRPWEIKAFQMEDVLYNGFMKEIYGKSKPNKR